MNCIKSLFLSLWLHIRCPCTATAYLGHFSLAGGYLRSKHDKDDHWSV